MPRNYMTKNDREAAFQCIQAERVRDRAPKMGGVDYYDLDQKAKRSGLSEYALRRHCEAAEAMLLEVAVSGVTLDDPRIDYVEIQIDRETWQAIRAAVGAKEEGRDGD